MKAIFGPESQLPPTALVHLLLPGPLGIKGLPVNRYFSSAAAEAKEVIVGSGSFADPVSDLLLPLLIPLYPRSFPWLHLPPHSPFAPCPDCVGCCLFGRDGLWTSVGLSRH